MRNISFLILITSFFWFGGCATQGRLTSLIFFEKDSNFETLNTSVEKLKSKYDSTIREQFSALRELRYITKHMDEPGKREIALRALTFFAFVSDDGDIRDRSISRLQTILKSDDWPLFLKYAVIDSTVDLITGELGFQEIHDGVNMHFGIRSSLRKDAILFLLSNYDLSLIHI